MKESVLDKTVRRTSREVLVGALPLGGGHPLRLQSMTTTDTDNIDQTADQTALLAKAGCDLVRITAPTASAAKALGQIKKSLISKGVNVPLAADIHFNPQAALEAAEHVEKVRINPGNFSDSKRFNVREYSDQEYQEELSRIEKAFTPLVLKCKELKRAMRIGTNHGSLSDRILNRFGDTPKGMVESALEYLHVAERQDFHNIVFSMKASNPVVMLQANRLLVQSLDQKNAPYPLHLGVTEAGGGEDARIKSALGIGTLLAEGIGDTIRVSLTEDPVKEVPVAAALAQWAQNRWANGVEVPEPLNPYEYARRVSKEAFDGTLLIGGENPVRVGLMEGDFDHPRKAGTKDHPCEFVLNPETAADKFHIVEAEELLSAGRTLGKQLATQEDRKPVILVWDARRFKEDNVQFLIEAAVQVAGLLVDGLGDAVVIRAGFKAERLLDLTYSLLQAARVRSTRTEYIACPGCGRTLFELNSTTERIKSKTGHLKGVKIAVMGCIVNGPGEMADADFGYVGGSPGTVNLYVGKECVQRGIPTQDADGKLIELIKAHGKWIEPVSRAC